jgi:hypothetical protein
MVSKSELITALATWIREDHAVRVAAVQLPMGIPADAMCREAVAQAGAEPVYVSMQGLAGTDLGAAARSPMAVTFKKKVIVVFEFDAMVSSDQTLLGHVAAAIKLNRVPVVLVGNSFRAKATDLPKGHAFFDVVSENPHDYIRAVTKFSGRPDSLRDKGLAGAEAALRGIQQDYRGDGIALGGVYDNYLGGTSAIPVADLLIIAEAFSWADVVSEGMCRACNFEDPYSYVPVSTAAAVLAGAGAPVPIATFGTVWSKTNAMYAKVNNMRALSRGMVEAGSAYAWTATTGLDCVRSMVARAVGEGDVQKAARVARDAGVSPAALLSLMRLWKSKYTLATHAKVRRAMEAL